LNVSFFQELLTTIADRGRSLIDLSIGPLSGSGDDTIEDLSRALITSLGEASGVALAAKVLERYKQLDERGKRNFFHVLATEFIPRQEDVAAAAGIYLDDPTPQHMEALSEAVASPRQEFFRRLNLAPGATAEIVCLRTDLQQLIKDDPDLRLVDKDLVHLLASWFNRGFLVLQRIDWSTPASILEKIIAYEAVHEIQGWEDLRRRLDPADRRCYAFFHPSLVDEPLIFVEVALTHDIPNSIQTLLEQERKTDLDGKPPTTAVFYSISNCQEGLAGISFGNFLIKQLVGDLSKEIPTLKSFVTLSPIPGFSRWLSGLQADEGSELLSHDDRDFIKTLKKGDWLEDSDLNTVAKEFLLPLVAHYFLFAQDLNGRPWDPVARFHLGNGARLERINWLGDISAKGLGESYSLMVNYLYDINDIEKNHEAYINERTVIAAKSVHSLLGALSKPKALATINE